MDNFPFAFSKLLNSDWLTCKARKFNLPYCLSNRWKEADYFSAASGLSFFGRGLSFCGSRTISLQATDYLLAASRPYFNGQRTIFLWPGNYLFAASKLSFCGQQTIFLRLADYLFAASGLSFCGQRTIFLWPTDYLSAHRRLSFCGQQRTIVVSNIFSQNFMFNKFVPRYWHTFAIAVLS